MAPAASASRASKSSRGCTHQVVADRIEAGTFLCAVAATGGDVVLRHGRADHLDAVIEKLREAGATVAASRTASTCVRRAAWRRRASAPPNTRAFRPTCRPSSWRSTRSREGPSKVTETIFENRFMHVNELVRLGARIQVDGKVAVIEGVEKLSGATVMATDLRASASLVIAGLVAEGETLVDRIYHLDRGYDQMEAKLRGIGADIERIK